MTTDDLNLAVRNLVRTVMGMADGSVRPTNQVAPAGAQTLEIATVQIITAAELGWANEGQIDNSDGSSTATVDALEEVVASIQFFRSPNPDPVGLAKFSTAAVDRARALCRRLQLPSAVAAMNAAGLGLLRMSQVRDLTAIADSTWESRASVDLTFDVSTLESEAVQTILTGEIDLTFQPPGNAAAITRTFQVTT